MMKTGQDFKDQVKKLHLTSWEYRQCSLCGAPQCYLFENDKVYYDSNCYCVPYRREDVSERSWDSLARMYNEAKGKFKEELDKFWQWQDETPIPNQ